MFVNILMAAKHKSLDERQIHDGSQRYDNISDWKQNNQKQVEME